MAPLRESATSRPSGVAANAASARTPVEPTTVVGLACAAELARRGDDVLAVERLEGWGRETSSRNSGVVHAGLYYPSGSLKARTCVEGRELLYARCRRDGVAHRISGKLIVAAREDVTEADVMAHCHGQLARYKQPKGVGFVDEIPRNPTGKPLKRLLRERFPGPAAE